jgi:hypothetical protein
MLGLPDMSNAKRHGAFKFDLMVCVLNQLRFNVGIYFPNWVLYCGHFVRFWVLISPKQD